MPEADPGSPTESQPTISVVRRSWARVTLAWLAAIGVDLLFHAGLFAEIFDASREPSLLSDDVLFRRIPVAYATLLLGIVALAWLLQRFESTGESALGFGAGAGLVVGAMGFGGLWTAVDITGLLVVAGTVVLVAQGIAAAKVLTSELGTRPLSYRVVAFVLSAFLVGQVAANL